MGNTKNPLILYHSKTLTSSARFHFPVISAWFPSFLSAPLVPFSTDFHSISAPANSRKFPFSWRTYLNYQWMYILHNSSNKFVEPNEKLAVYKYKSLTANSTEKNICHHHISAKFSYHITFLSTNSSVSSTASYLSSSSISLHSPSLLYSTPYQLPTSASTPHDHGKSLKLERKKEGRSLLPRSFLRPLLRKTRRKYIRFSVVLLPLPNSSLHKNPVFMVGLYSRTLLTVSNREQ